ncbi:MAG: NAD(P)/FAD-dependent oxidoreductase [Phenylobacterium sp.]|uniref:NAD(P)/FAD-dependent oxidoreductase n=1 Tax=Phenylobacterium sp. TaxID=1871053 RepID=UPI00271FEF93|nr:NAD(P)/FAD-dependent oxidoreductase [Phenylobacterium sp.]MDO8411068.1 NAD(P)/FAD-dependent oxidoreductase [Phenylobacterium sp.]
MTESPQAYEAIVIGAGPAGLTAATYLARFRRRVLVLDGGTSRAAWIPESHNTPGFPAGISGTALLQRLRDQAEEYGAVISTARADRLEQTADGFRLYIGGDCLEAPTVLLATGLVDHLPAIPGVDAALATSLARVCPICDAYEAIDASLAVVGDGPLALREAEFLRTYSQDVTVLMLGDEGAGLADVLPAALDDIRFEDREVVFAPQGRAEQRFDYLYLALGCAVQADLATALGARQDDSGKLLADAHQMTTVDGLYVAGDVVLGLNQIAVATGEAAIAATAMHNRLRKA